MVEHDDITMADMLSGRNSQSAHVSSSQVFKVAYLPGLDTSPIEQLIPEQQQPIPQTSQRASVQETQPSPKPGTLLYNGVMQKIHERFVKRLKL